MKVFAEWDFGGEQKATHLRVPGTGDPKRHGSSRERKFRPSITSKNSARFVEPFHLWSLIKIA